MLGAAVNSVERAPVKLNVAGGKQLVADQSSSGYSVTPHPAILPVHSVDLDQLLSCGRRTPPRTRLDTTSVRLDDTNFAHRSRNIEAFITV